MKFFNSSYLEMGINVGFLVVALFVVLCILSGIDRPVFRQEGAKVMEVKSGIEDWDLNTAFGRELASIEKPISPFDIKKCGEIKHTDGGIMTICIVKFSGTSGGFYDGNRDLMVIGSFSEYTLVHEVFHAASIYNYKKGYTEMMSAQTQERMAYDAENLLMQICSFQEDLTLTPDLDDEKKMKLGLSVKAVTTAIKVAKND
jgi:hypothetical protein